MKKIIIVIILVIAIVFLLKYSKREYLSNGEDLTTNDEYVNQQIEESDERRLDLYIYSIKLIVSNVSKYIDEKEYIAFQSEELIGLNDDQIQEVFNYISDLYDIEVVDGDYDDLVDRGIDSGNGEPEGIFIQMSHVEMQGDSAEVHIGAGYASLGGEGYKIFLNYREGRWYLLNMELLWEA